MIAIRAIIVVVALFSASTGLVAAESAVPPEYMARDRLGCLNKDDASQLAKIAYQGDLEAFKALATRLILASRCDFLKAGTQVYLSDTAVFSGMQCVRPRGAPDCYWVSLDDTTKVKPAAAQ